MEQPITIKSKSIKTIQSQPIITTNTTNTTTNTTPSFSYLNDLIPISQFSTTTPHKMTTTTTQSPSNHHQPIQTNQLTLPFPSSSTSSSTTKTTTAKTINTSSSKPTSNHTSTPINSKSDRKPSTSSSSSNNTSHTKPIKPPAQCSFCGMTFKKLEHCQRHERTHTLARPYTCTVCLKTFARQDTLNRHLRLHTRPEDGQATKSKKRNHRNSISSTNTTPPTPTHSSLPSINLPSSFNPSPYFSSPQVSRSRPARERGFSLSAIDEQSPCNTNHPTYHPLPFSTQPRQSISLPPHWNQYPSNLVQPSANPNPNHNHQNPSEVLNHSWESNSNQNHLTSTSPLIPNLSSPAPLDSNFLAELSSYTLTDLPSSTSTHPSFQSIPTSHSHSHSSSSLLPPPMSAPPTCTTWGDLAQPFHPNSSSNHSPHPSHLLPHLNQEHDLLLDPWAHPTSGSSSNPTWFNSTSSSATAAAAALHPSYQLSAIHPHHPLSTRNLEHQNLLGSTSGSGSGFRSRSTSQPEGFHDWNLSNPSTTYHT